MFRKGKAGSIFTELSKTSQEDVLAGILKDIAKSVGILMLVTLIGHGFARLGFTEANIITVYILGVLVTSVATSRRIYSLIISVVSVLVFNFFFTVPKFTLLAYEKGYPVTFLIMFIAAFITGSLAAKLKEHARQEAQAAYRTKVLLDTNQLLQRAKNRDEIIRAAANQIVKLLEREVIVYLPEGDELGEPRIFSELSETKNGDCISDKDRQTAAWVFKNNRKAGAGTDIFSDARYLYFAIRVNNHVYGVVGIETVERGTDTFETGILLSILGECAFAIENEKNSREKEQAAILVKNEQLRANLLRSISHDLRTPLTTISGNASNLLSNGQSFDEKTRTQIYIDIYDDAMWLINLVENLLSVSRIEEGRMNVKVTSELMDEVIVEALHHVNRKSIEHKITVRSTEEYILAQIDARLIVQVVINIVDNAIKYTPKGSEITIVIEKCEDKVIVHIGDNGPGIPDEAKPHIFDMFYSGTNSIADSRRSLGLGLSLCKSIIIAHGGNIEVTDNAPHGAVFTFTLPAGEVNLHE